MKIRLMSVYHGKYLSLAILTEYDYFKWVGGITDKGISYLLENVRGIQDDSQFRIELPTCSYDEMFINGGHITNAETIHIIGDFESLEELHQWLQMQHLLDCLNTESLKTLTKE